MTIFSHPNMTKFECPICKTNEDKPITLIAIVGTEKEGKEIVTQVHVACIDLEILTLQDGSKWLVQLL